MNTEKNRHNTIIFFTVKDLLLKHKDNLNYKYQALQVDQSFKSFYPHLTTRVFKIDQFHYQILVDNIVDARDFEEIKNNFDNSIKIMTCPVVLVNATPTEYEIEITNDSQNRGLSSLSGLPLSKKDIRNLITCWFNDVQVIKIQTDHQKYTITILVFYDGYNKAEKRLQIQSKINSIKSIFKIIVEISSNRPSDSHSISEVSKEVFSLTPSRVEMKYAKAPYLERDESLWFDNYKSMYRGEYRKRQLYFFDAEKSSCLLNLSMFENTNIRNNILLYDTLYCVMPLKENMSEMLRHQNITKKDLLHLISKGRLKLVCNQPVIRLDHEFLLEAYNLDHNSVISRRALCALLAIDLVDINKNYIFSDPEIHSEIFDYISEFSSIINRNHHDLAKLMLWPRSALMRSFSSLNFNGPMNVAHFGINKIITETMNPYSPSELSTERSQAIDFEFTMHSGLIHLAHALESTYFPFFQKSEPYSEYPYSAVMGKFLNFYKAFSYENSRDLASEFNRVAVNEDYANLIQINDYLSIEDFEKTVSSNVVRSDFNSLFQSISNLSVKERHLAISDYNLKLQNFQEKNRKYQACLRIAEDGIGLIIPFLGTGKTFLSSLTQRAINEYPTVKKVSEFIERKTETRSKDKREIKLLNKIGRVARIQIKND